MGRDWGALDAQRFTRQLNFATADRAFDAAFATLEVRALR